MTDRLPKLNKRDPSGTRSAEERVARNMRKALKRGIARATARIVQSADTSPARMESILSEVFDGETRRDILRIELESIELSDSQSSTRVDKILKGMGIELGSTDRVLHKETVDSLWRNVVRDIDSLMLDTKKVIFRTVTDGVQRGLGAKGLSKEIAEATSLPLARSETIARTTVMKTFNETAMDRYETAGAIGFYIYPTDDSRLCDKCLSAAMDGKKFRLYKERPSLPIHPNCRCCVIPSFDGTELEFSAYSPTVAEKVYFSLWRSQ